MKHEIENYWDDVKEFALQYCRENGLNPDKFPLRKRGFSPTNKTSGYVLYAKPNPEDRGSTEQGIDDRHPAFPVMLVHYNKETDSFHFRCEETEYTRKYLA